MRFSDAGHRSRVWRRSYFPRSVDQDLQPDKTMERSTAVAPRRSSNRCATRPKPLRCDCQRMQKKRALAIRAVAALRDVEGEAGAHCRQLQRWNQCVRE
eukprot:3607128-Pyramimonas_sp.AAC.1